MSFYLNHLNLLTLSIIPNLLIFHLVTDQLRATSMTQRHLATKGIKRVAFSPGALDSENSGKQKLR